MDYEFHFYINYLIAKLGGFSSKESYTIAYSSQYVDDNSTRYNVRYGDYVFTNSITQTYNLTLPTEELIKIYSTLHFIPGEKTSAERVDGKTHELVTTPNSQAANRLLDQALSSGNLYEIGIASHAYADTWAHQNFTATFDDFNSGHSFLAKLLPNIGHADFLEYPDLIGVTWLDTRLIDQRICNNQRFRDCAEALLKKYAAHNGVLYNSKKLSKFFGESQPFNPLTFYSKRAKRIKAYGDEIPPYNPTSWFSEAVNFDGAGYYFIHENFTEKPWYKFQSAANKFKKS